MRSGIEFKEADSSKYQEFEQDFFRQNSLVVAPALVGCVIFTERNGEVTGGIITETEAYPAFDPASHVYGLKRVTPRTEVQYKEGGCLYVYLIMGLHVMTSVVTSRSGVADVVFIRSLEPLIGIEEMRKRRKYFGKDLRRLTAGPGRLSEALDIGLQDQSKSLFDPDSKVTILKDNLFCAPIESGKRVNLGVSKAKGNEAQVSVDQPWRFYLKDSLFLS